MNIPQIHLNSNDTDNTDDCDEPQQKSSHANLSNNSMEKRTQHKSMTTSTISNPTSTTSMSTLEQNNTEQITTSPTTTITTSSNHSPTNRMSMFFFRLHNLQREQENKRKKSVQQQRQRQRRGAKVFRSGSETGHLTLGPSRLFEKTPIKPSDSLDEIALQIPRYLYEFSAITLSAIWQSD